MPADRCARCGTPTPLHLLDAKPAALRGPGDWIERLFPRLRLRQLRIAADRGADFDWLECARCYGPGYVATLSPDSQEDRHDD